MSELKVSISLKDSLREQVILGLRSTHCMHFGAWYPSSFHETSQSIIAMRDGSVSGPPGFETWLSGLV